MLNKLRSKFSWLYQNKNIIGVLLVGSHARGDTRQGSDIDLVIITDSTKKLLEDTDWITKYGKVIKKSVEDYGPLKSLRVFYQDGSEVEYGITTSVWTNLNPLDQGTIKVLRGGHKVLYDPKGLFSALSWKYAKSYGHANHPRIEINIGLVRKLIDKQFPEFEDMELRPVTKAGWCNGAYRLGDEYLVKFPRAKRYEQGHFAEADWLPYLSRNLNIKIPEYVSMGRPDLDYEWHWSVFKWIEGESAEKLSENAKVQFATDIAKFLKNLWSIKVTDGPRSFDQSFHRGGPLYVYDEESRVALEKVKDLIDYEAVKHLWEKAVNSKLENDPVWVHGDLFPANMLIQNNRLHAVLDFENMCIGDPACDLALTWTFFEGDGRKVFVNELSLDENTWIRGRGWALWKALISLASIKDKQSKAARERINQINDLIVPVC